MYTVPLRFDGAALGSRNTDGPYTLTGLSLTYRAPGVEFPQPNQVAGDVYTTAPYDVNQFEDATVGPPAHSTHRVADQDGDGLHDHSFRPCTPGQQASAPTFSLAASRAGGRSLLSNVTN